MSAALPTSLARLIDELARLPGIGPKTASRLAYHMLRSSREQVLGLAHALIDVTQAIRTCERCQSVAETSPCPICSDATRDSATICVVEDPLDVLAIERAGVYRGLYHVLHGALSPVDGIGPAELRIEELLSRLRREPVQEIILATNPSLEGDATAMYLERAIRNLPLTIRITRLARGLPIGGDIEYADEGTLARALAGRSDMERSS